MAKGKSKLKEVGNVSNATFKPMMISQADYGGTAGAYSSPSSNYPTHRNRAATIPRLEKYKNIKEGIYPYFRRNDIGANPNTPTLDIREAIVLCQLAYYNIPLFRNAIDMMTDLANSKYILKNGNTASKAFIEKWLQRIDIWRLGDQFFREYFRSGNIFLYRFDGDFRKKDKIKFNKVFASADDETLKQFGQQPELATLENDTKIPLRYMVLNPADIRATHNVTFVNLAFYKILTGDELLRLRNPQTEEDMAVIRNLGPEAIASIKRGASPMLPLNIKHLTTVFCNKQDYEPFAVPWGFSVLEDLDVKLELKKMDAAVARTTEYAILLITMGESPANGGLGINPDNLKAAQSLFQSDSLKKVLVADFTTKGEWLIPDLNKVLGSAKYEQLDKDIKEGLSLILTGEEKFANSQAKVAVFTERLKKARSEFARWLQIEIRRVCKDMNFKSVPDIEFEDINLENQIEFSKLFVQMYSLGLLTPEELFDALQSGKIPTIEENIESQQTWKKQRGVPNMYVPVVGGAKAGGPPTQGGRPTGTTAPKSTNKVSPQGSSRALGYSMAKIIELSKLSNKLFDEIEAGLKTKFKLKKLNAVQIDTANTFLKCIVANESPETWESKVSEYIEKPKNIDETIAREIDDLCVEHNIEFLAASLLRNAKETEE